MDKGGAALTPGHLSHEGSVRRGESGRQAPSSQPRPAAWFGQRGDFHAREGRPRLSEDGDRVPAAATPASQARVSARVHGDSDAHVCAPAPSVGLVRSARRLEPRATPPANAGRFAGRVYRM